MNTPFVCRSPATLVSTVALACAAAMAGCTEQNDALVVQGLDSAEPALAAFLAERVASAQALPASGAMRGRLAMAYHANGFADAALASYAQAEELDPHDGRWPYLSALLLAESGAQEAALGNLERALKLDPAYPPAWLWRGTWLLDDDRSDEAAQAFQRALALAEPPSLPAADNPGRTRLRDALARSTAEGSAMLAATVGLARALLREGNAQQAAALLEPVVADFAHPHPSRILAQAYRALGREDEARRYAELSREATPLTWVDERREALTAHVRGFSGMLSKAETLIEQGRAQAALRILEPLREEQPHDRVLLNNLAAAYGTTDRPQAVLDVLLPALERHEDNHLFHFNIALAYGQLNQREEALLHVNRALVLRPSFLPAREEQVALLVDAAHHDEALAAVEAAVLDGVQTAALLFYAGLIEGYRERWPVAIERFEEAVRLDPAHARAHLYLAHALIEAGRVAGARAALALAAAAGISSEEIAAARARIRSSEARQ